MFVMCLPRLVIVSVGGIKLNSWGFISVIIILILIITYSNVNFNPYY